MKTKKTILMVITMMIMMTGLSFAGETATSLAKKDLYENINKCFKQEMKNWNNYFYQNDINKVKEDVRITFKVDDDQTISLLRVSCPNQDAKDYVKYMFKTNEIKANEIMVGKAFVFNLRLYYKAF